MNKRAFLVEKNAEYHLQGNAAYDMHLKALKNIYTRPKTQTVLQRPALAALDREGLAGINKSKTFKLNNMCSLST